MRPLDVAYDFIIGHTLYTVAAKQHNKCFITNEMIKITGFIN